VDVCEAEDLYQWDRGASLLDMLRFYGGRDELRQCGFYHVIDPQKLFKQGLLIVLVVVIQQIIVHQQFTSVQ